MSYPVPIPIAAKVFQNASETALDRESATLENAYVTEMGNISRFPQLVERVRLPLKNRVYLKEWRKDLYASCGGRTFRIDNSFNQEDLTGASVTGSGRTVFAETDDELVMAAGGPIIRLKGEKTDLLSVQAPQTTHIGYVNGYLAAVEVGSGRFQAAAAPFQQWDPLNTFSAEGNPDNINSLLVTEFQELLLSGEKSIEQFDQSPSGTKPFFKRWGLGNGLITPYAFLSVNNLIWGMDKRREWVAYSAQLGNIASGDIQAQLEKLDTIEDAWAAPIAVEGQRFQIIQFPHATNVYGTKGVTLLFDYIKNRWATLYGWDTEKAVPTRWPGWSYEQVGDRKFVGGEGVIYELTGYDGAAIQRLLWRSGHLRSKRKGEYRVDGIEMVLERGAAATGKKEPIISLRVNKNNQGFGRWVRRGIGKTGQRNMTLRFPAMGSARTFQFEIMVADDTPIEISEATMYCTDLG